MTYDQTIEAWKAKIAQIDASRKAIIGRLNEFSQEVPTDAQRQAQGLDPVRLHEIAGYLKNPLKDCRIKVVDGSLQSLPTITPDSVQVGGATYSPQYAADGYLHVDVHPTDSFDLRVKKQGYSTYGQTHTFATLDGRQIPIVPIVDGYRAVLTWGAQPNDLDTHCFVYQGTAQVGHVYFVEKSYSGYGTTVTLDVDIIPGYGPETLTISPFVPDLTYKYYVHKYSGTGTIGQGGLATVTVYAGESSTIINCTDTENTGIYWHVFDIIDGEFQIVNRFEDP